MQNMINAVIFMALFDGKDIFRFRDDTDRAVISVVIVTDAADITFRQVLAYLAAMDIFSGLDDCIGKQLRLSVRKRKHVKCQTLCAFSAYSRQRSKFIDQVFH